MNLDEFQRRVDAYFQCDQRNEPGGRIILDLMRALREAHAEHEQLKAWIKADNEHAMREREVLRDLINTQREKMAALKAEYETLREAYGRLMQGVEEKMQHREPALGPLGMGSAEGIKDQAKTFELWEALRGNDIKKMHDDLRAKYPDLPDLTPILQGADGALREAHAEIARLTADLVTSHTAHIVAEQGYAIERADNERLRSENERLREHSRLVERKLEREIENEQLKIANYLTVINAMRIENDRLKTVESELRAKLRTIDKLNADNLADIDALLAKRRLP